MIPMTAGIKGRFQGDPSYEYENYDKREEGEKPYEEETGTLVKEEIRLVITVDQIDKAVGIVPRGAYLKTPLGPVHENRSFEGLSLTEAKKLSSYFHFTEPVNLKNKTLLEKADLDPSIDFLDSLEHDIPKGSSDKLDTDQKDLEELGLPHLLEFCLQSRNQTEDTDERRIGTPDFQIHFG